MTTATRKPLLVNIAWAAALALLLAVGYVLSYAPVVRITGRWPGEFAAYSPADWLIERTVLREPLLAWADTCGVGEEFRTPRLFLEIQRRWDMKSD